MRTVVHSNPFTACSRRPASRWTCSSRKSQFQASKDTSATPPQGSSQDDPEEVAKKWGLEAGIWNAFRNDAGKVSAKDLLHKYGAAYLLTSISLAIVSFTACYLAVDAGVDMPGFLARFGFSAPADSAVATGSKVALAYTAHKALSPVRFPPTVALTPIVASRIGKGKDQGSKGVAEKDKKKDE